MTQVVDLASSPEILSQTDQRISPITYVQYSFHFTVESFPRLGRYQYIVNIWPSTKSQRLYVRIRLTVGKCINKIWWSRGDSSWTRINLQKPIWRIVDQALINIRRVLQSEWHRKPFKQAWCYDKRRNFSGSFRYLRHPKPTGHIQRTVPHGFIHILHLFSDRRQEINHQSRQLIQSSIVDTQSTIFFILL